MIKTAVIMAGGYGERFWPLSRMKNPKQILKLTGSELNMMQESIARISDVINPKDIFVITSADLLEPIRKSVPEIPAANIIAEPAKRNTAPCLALAAAIISARYSDSDDSNIVMAVLTADHKIEPKENFATIIDSTLNFVSQNSKLATFGIKPNRPETGYGYIEQGNKLDNSISDVLSFREKPDIESAVKYIESGNFLWNSGMFFWKLSTFNEQMILHYPEIGNQIPVLKKLYNDFHHLALDTSNPIAFDLFSSLPSISIDYALMEKSNDVVVAESDFTWDDVGSWDSLDRVRKKDVSGNITDGDVLLLESTDSIVINQSSEEFTVTAVGIDNLVIIATKDSIMICPKDKAQDVKKIVVELRNQKRTNLL